MFDRESFMDYVGAKSGNSYASGLSQIEKLYDVDIETEYESDLCTSLLARIDIEKKDPSFDAREQKTRSNMSSHLKKYIEFRENSDAYNQRKLFTQWMSEQPRRDDPTKRYSQETIEAAAAKLQTGLQTLGIRRYSQTNCFTITDAAVFAELHSNCYSNAEASDKRQGHRDFRNGLDFYLLFLNHQNNTHIEPIAPITKKIKKVIQSYKENFQTVNEQEIYKWEAIGWYKKHWNIDAEDFAEMLSNAFSKAFNLLSSGMYYPYKVITDYAKRDPEKVRELFRMLHDETLPLATRYESFRDGCMVYIDLIKKEKPDYQKSLQHYQDLRAILVYLTFEYPEKYYLYKSSMFSDFKKRVGYEDKQSKTDSITWKYESFSRMCNIILDVIEADQELLNMSRSRLHSECYRDPAQHLLTMDIVFYGSNYMSEDDFIETTPLTNAKPTYWPSLDEYNPNLSKEDWMRFILEIELPNHPTPMEMLKGLMLLGGEATCKKLAAVYGGHPSGYVGTAVNLGKRAKKYFNLPPCMDKDQERYFPIPFLGRYVKEDGIENYSYLIRPELHEALKEIDLSRINPYFTDNEESNIAVPETNTDVGLNTILYGPPGTGKTYHTVIYAVAIIERRELASVEAEEYVEVLQRYNNYKEQGLIEFTTFHQSYGYEEFIEGIKPIVSTDGNVRYQVCPGTFKAFCENNSSANRVFIIDEINRGNISKIFGELITLIEPSKRLGQPEGMKIMLPYSQKLFGVPKNIYIIGTMNTADRSIATIDTALRRRFLFREMLPNPNVLSDISVEDLSISDLLTQLNKRITVLYDREHTIGHAYFMQLKISPTIETLAEIFTNNIIPLLQEYFYEDYEKIRLVLGDNKKTDPNEQFIIAKENNFAELFGDIDIGLDDGFTYVINHSAFANIETYRSI